MTLYRMKYKNWTLKDYCADINNQAALIQREIEALQIKRDMLFDFARKLENDFIPALQEGSQISADKQAQANLGSCVKGEV